MKQRIILKETDLHNIIKETINRKGLPKYNG